MTPPTIAPSRSHPVDDRLTLEARINMFLRAALPRRSADRTAIQTLRAASNAAIARHNAAGGADLLSEDALVLTSADTRVEGRAAMIKAFDRAFSDPNFVTYVRSPCRVVIHGDGRSAAEYGQWTAVRRDRHRGGLYLARWAKTAEGWRVRWETYAPVA